MKKNLKGALNELRKFLRHTDGHDAWRNDQRSVEQETDKKVHRELQTRYTSTWSKNNWNIN